MEKKLDYLPQHSGQVFLLALLVPLLIQIIFSIIGSSNPQMFKETWFLSIYRLMLAGGFVGVFFAFNKMQHISNFACGIKNKTNPWIVLVCLALIVGFLFLTSPFVSWIDYWISLTGIKVDGSIGFSLDGFGNFLLVVLMLGIIPAVTEELIFRGMIFQGLKKYGKWPAILISAAAFSLMHLNIPQFPYTFLLGILLGFVMYETRSLWLCMLMHFANNFVVLLSAFVSGEAQSIEAEATSTPIWAAILFFVAAILLAACAMWLVHKLAKQKNQNNLEIAQNTEQTKEKPENPKFLIFDLMYLLFGFLLAIVLTCVYTF